MKTNQKTIAVIGAGASGMTAAITAAQKGGNVWLFEAGERVGKKILSTGNGKCNLGNQNLSEDAYYSEDPAFVWQALTRFGTQETIAFFESLGLFIKDRGGYLYPSGEQAALVLDVLRLKLRQLPVELVPSTKITAIERTKDGKFYLPEAGRAFNRVVVATGGKAAPKTGSDGTGYLLAKQLGHTVIPVVPGLVQLRCKDADLKAIAGVRCEGEVCVLHNKKVVARDGGELQFTEYGISGIPVFQVSRVVNRILQTQKEVTVTLALLPPEKLKERITGRKDLRAGRTIEEYLTGLANKKLVVYFLKKAGIKPQQPADLVSEGELMRFLGYLHSWELTVTGSMGFDHAQVSAGGVDTRELTPDLESRLAPGVYFAGEVVDVDGKCGGYNLQWAWTSGYLAGSAAAGEKTEKMR